MKNRNQERIDRWLVFAFALMTLAVPSCHVNKGQIRSNTTTTDTIVFEGTLVKLGSDPGTVSGISAVYRLAKYRVNKVCEGKYEGSEIVVDHLVFTLKEFEGIQVNDHVCLTVRVSNKILERYNAEGIRSPSDDIKIFYVAHEGVKLTDEHQTCCANPKNEQ